jgi:hypothetical protein
MTRHLFEKVPTVEGIITDVWILLLNIDKTRRCVYSKISNRDDEHVMIPCLMRDAMFF